MNDETQEAVAVKAGMEGTLLEKACTEKLKAVPVCPMCQHPLHARVNEFGIQDWHCHNCGIRSRY